jgi:hypothetical protein
MTEIMLIWTILSPFSSKSTNLGEDMEVQNQRIKVQVGIATSQMSKTKGGTDNYGDSNSATNCL